MENYKPQEFVEMPGFPLKTLWQIAEDNKVAEELQNRN